MLLSWFPNLLQIKSRHHWLYREITRKALSNVQWKHITEREGKLTPPDLSLLEQCQVLEATPAGTLHPRTSDVLCNSKISLRLPPCFCREHFKHVAHASTQRQRVTSKLFMRGPSKGPRFPPAAHLDGLWSWPTLAEGAHQVAGGAGS